MMAVISPKRNRKIRRYHCKELYKVLQECCFFCSGYSDLIFDHMTPCISLSMTDYRDQQSDVLQDEEVPDGVDR
jgi:hypothetical protein